MGGRIDDLEKSIGDLMEQVRASWVLLPLRCRLFIECALALFFLFPPPASPEAF